MELLEFFSFGIDLLPNENYCEFYIKIEILYPISPKIPNAGLFNHLW
jgi:hypothetical protein